MTVTVQDTFGRSWTIATERAVVGFKWHIYCHFQGQDVSPGALELMHPGGVAHGWTDDDHDERSVRTLLVAIMSTKGALEAAP